MAIDTEEILHEISEIRALLTRLQPVEGKNNNFNNNNSAVRSDGGKRVLILF